MATPAAHNSMNRPPLRSRRTTVFGVLLVILVAGSALSALVYVFPDLLFPTVVIGVIAATALLSRLATTDLREAPERFWVS
jgi:prepilin signal peptidase PulO-like enzyme (type II secretory pathway)